VLIVFQLGQPRIFFSMARDGLFPKWAAAVHPRFGTPHVTTLISGVFVAVLSGFANLDEIVQLTNIGTLFAFILVCIGITVLRVRDPGRERSFRVPGGPYLIPILGVVSCVTLIVYLPPTSWWRFIGWLVLGMAVYFWYGYQRSVVGRESGRSPRADALVNLIGLGFFVLTVGLFVLPHDQGPKCSGAWRAMGRSGDMRQALWGAGWRRRA
jgi:APA family basic amino acid/polyamine antiporter